MTDDNLELLAREALAGRFPPQSPIELPPPAGWSYKPRHRFLLVTTAAVIVLLAVALGGALGQRDDHASGDGPLSNTSATLSSQTRDRVVRFVRQFERSVGGGKVARVEVTMSTRGRAVRLAMGGDIVKGDEPVVVIELTASTMFRAITTGPSAAGSNRDVKYQVSVLNAQTFQGTDGSLSNHHVDLSVLGPVTTWKP